MISQHTAIHTPTHCLTSRGPRGPPAAAFNDGVVCAGIRCSPETRFGEGW
jgi:hypothetical protein